MASKADRVQVDVRGEARGAPREDESDQSSHRSDGSRESVLASFAFLCPMTGGFRNYISDDHFRRPEVELVDRANQLTLPAPEMTVLIRGIRALGANYHDSKHRVIAEKPGPLTNDFFVNLLDMSTEWKKSDEVGFPYVGYDRETGKPKWTATAVDLVFGSNSQLRALAEAYASDDAKLKFVPDFVAAGSSSWTWIASI